MMVDRGSPGSLADRVLASAFIAGLMVIVLLSGGFLTAADVFPGPQIARAYQGGKALYDKLTGYQDVYASDLWHPARSGEGASRSTTRRAHRRA